MIAFVIMLACFALFASVGLHALRQSGIGRREEKVPTPAEPVDPWISPQGVSEAGTHVWAGYSTKGILRTPGDGAAIIVGPPKAGKTRKVIAPTLACWDGPALVTSTKGDILASAAHRAGRGPVALYDPTGSLGHPEISVGFSPLGRCESWDGAVEVAAALLTRFIG